MADLRAHRVAGTVLAMAATAIVVSIAEADVVLNIFTAVPGGDLSHVRARHITTCGCVTFGKARPERTTLIVVTVVEDATSVARVGDCVHR